jgi:hypothetical protein
MVEVIFYTELHSVFKDTKKPSPRQGRQKREANDRKTNTGHKVRKDINIYNKLALFLNCKQCKIS